MSADTRLLVRRAVQAWHRTGGRFDPGVLDALELLGYDRSFELIAAAPDPPAPAAPRPSGGCAQVVVDDAAGTVRLPPGLRLDPGGIGKGLAADLVTKAMLAAGAVGACANLAGDVRCRGRGPGPDGRWAVGIEDPWGGEPLGVLSLPPGGAAVATSSVLVRRWAPGVHHLLDPLTGAPATGDVVAATVVADDAAWADAATKAALVGSGHREALALLETLDVAALLVLGDGTVRVTPQLHRFVDGSAQLPERCSR